LNRYISAARPPAPKGFQPLSRVKYRCRRQSSGLPRIGNANTRDACRETPTPVGCVRQKDRDIAISPRFASSYREPVNVQTRIQ